MNVGDIVRIYSPVAGYDKYHLCIEVGASGAASVFLFLNSDGYFADCYCVPCAALPFLPPSKTGQTAFSFANLPRYNDNQLRIYSATVLGAIDQVLAAELLRHAQGVQALNRIEKALVVAALSSLS